MDPKDQGAVTRRTEFTPTQPPPSRDPLSVPTPLAVELRDTHRAIASVRPAVERRLLTVINGPNAGQAYVVQEAEHIIGRGDLADFRVEDPDVSRKHARLFRGPDSTSFILEDLDSTNGTFVNGHRVDSIVLQPGDRVQCGPNLIFRFAQSDDIEEELHRRMFESSTRDFLTRVFNRRYLVDRLAAEVAHARRHRTPLATLMIDLDRFKAINDRHGHAVGDIVLRAVAARIQRLIRIDDIFGRYGGEEFLLLARATSPDDAARLAERVRRVVAELEIPAADGMLRITASVGVAALADLDPAAGPADLVAKADVRLYQAKMSGRNRVCAEG
jgi:diguanylate cyclase (GGDEF)-like protein